jgi:hypothetical protein
MTYADYIPSDIREQYEIHDFKHAAAILANEFPAEFGEICDALRKFRFSTNDIIEAG